MSLFSKIKLFAATTLVLNVAPQEAEAQQVRNHHELKELLGKTEVKSDVKKSNNTEEIAYHSAFEEAAQPVQEPDTLNVVHEKDTLNVLSDTAQLRKELRELQKYNIEFGKSLKQPWVRCKLQPALIPPAYDVVPKVTVDMVDSAQVDNQEFLRNMTKTLLTFKYVVDHNQMPEGDDAVVIGATANQIFNKATRLKLPALQSKYLEEQIGCEATPFDNQFLFKYKKAGLLIDSTGQAIHPEDVANPRRFKDEQQRMSKRNALPMKYYKPVPSRF